MKKAIFGILLILLAGAVYAAPAISSAPETFSHGDSVSISGSGFGIKEPAHPLMYDDFEDGINPLWEHKYNMNTAITVGGIELTSEVGNLRHEFSSGALQGNFYNDYDSGSASAYFTHQPGFVPQNNPNSNKWYYKLWFKPHWIWHTQTEDIAFSKLKGPRFEASTKVPEPGGGYPTNAYEMRYNYVIYGNEFPTYSRYDFDLHPANEITMDEWHSFSSELQFNNPAGASNGITNIWFDERLVYSASDLLTDNYDTTEHVSEFGFYNARYAETDPNDRVWFDEMYIDNTWARIEICNVSAWAERENAGAICELQIPSSWSNGSIQFTANQGALPGNQNAYLYVIDEFGEVNENGHSIAFGEPPPCTPTTEICDNGIDDDCDSLIDCDDASDCETFPACIICTPTTEICGDGIDQDCDGSDLPCPLGRCDQETIEGLLGVPVISLLTSTNSLMCGGITGEATPRILMRGTTGTVSGEFIYEYDTTLAIDHVVQDLIASENYDIYIFNADNGQSTIIHSQSNSSGELSFSLAPLLPPSGGEPIINSLSSTTLSHNSSFTISGSDFGTKEPAAPLMYDDFEDGIDPGWGHKFSITTAITFGAIEPTTAPENLRHGFSTGALQGNWYNDTGEVNYTGVFTHQPGFVPQNNPNSNKWYYKLWFKPHWIWHTNPENMSFSKLKGPKFEASAKVPEPDGGYPTNTFEMRYDSVAYGNEFPTYSRYDFDLHPANDITMDEWHSFSSELQFNNPPGASNGITNIWFDERLVFNATDLLTDNYDTTEHVSEFGFFNARYAETDPNDRVWFDEMYIDNTWARIEICNVSAWVARENAGAICELQIPSSWSSGSIQFTANQGTFTSSQTAYLYVIDSEGNVSNGYPVSFS
ncbi:MAG: hypothetical protein ABID38_03005 [Candidatus Diapherotrites archaeon]